MDESSATAPEIALLMMNAAKHYSRMPVLLLLLLLASCSFGWNLFPECGTSLCSTKVCAECTKDLTVTPF